jgi:2-amino-4-hydroxy-6-hydroxymethyldihydropteridine diphosphokinase
MAIAYIGLGSNLDDPQQQLRTAYLALRALPDSELLAGSGLYRSAPMTCPGDHEAQPDYVNAVVKLRTELGPHELLDQLQAIEQSQGRQRLKTWGPRTLDLDILMYDDLQQQDERLCIPHPGIAEREFVLYPLQAIDEQLNIPGLGPLSALIEALPQVRPEGRLEYLGPIHE